MTMSVTFEYSTKIGKGINFTEKTPLKIRFLTDYRAKLNFTFVKYNEIWMLSQWDKWEY
jgi:hypothetical protein